MTDPITTPEQAASYADQLDQAILSAHCEMHDQCTFAVDFVEGLVEFLRSRIPASGEGERAAYLQWCDGYNNALHEVAEMAKLSPHLVKAIFVPAIAGMRIDVPSTPTQPAAADFARALPGGQMDDSTFEAIEDALDRADTPSMIDGRWLTLPERIAALPTQPAGDAIERAREIIAFLGGASAIDGHWFGDRPEGERGAFWWRKYLPELLSTLPAALQEPTP